MPMEHADRPIRQNIAWLRQCSATIRGTAALWLLWWPVLHACEAEAARLERTLARHPCPPADLVRGQVIDLGEWRRRKSAAPISRRHSAGDAA